MKISDFMLEPKEAGRYEVHFNYKDTFYFLSEDSRQQNKFVKGANLAKYLSGESGLIPKRKNSAIQNVREMVTALNIISARQVSSDQAPKVLGKEFHDNFLLVQEVQKQLTQKLLSANERLKFNPNDQELLVKVKVLREEKNELEKEIKAFEKQLRTYDAALSILNEKGFTEFGDIEK